MTNEDTRGILVVGGGMSGLTAALEAAEAGYDVMIVEKNPYLGGRVAQLHHYFPKLCPPSCGLEINFRRVKSSPRVRYFTLAEVQKVSGKEGAFSVDVKLSPRYVNEKCTACGKCSDACSMEIENKFNYGMDRMKAAYLPHEMAFPMHFVIDPALAQSPEAQAVKAACPYDAIDLEMKEKTVTLKAASIVWASGWEPYKAENLDTYDYANQPDVITNVMLERLAAPSGPTGGKILRPSDGQPPKSVAFLQCAGSRDRNHLPFCSGICCLASLKQAGYVREQYPEAEISMYYIDIRATDRLESFYQKSKAELNINFVKGKVARISAGESGNGLRLRVEDTAAEQLKELSADLVVLATGMKPRTASAALIEGILLDEYGFIDARNTSPGIYPAGCVKTPVNVSEAVQDGTAAALKAVQSVVRRAGE